MLDFFSYALNPDVLRVREIHRGEYGLKKKIKKIETRNITVALDERLKVARRRRGESKGK